MYLFMSIDCQQWKPGACLGKTYTLTLVVIKLLKKARIVNRFLGDFIANLSVRKGNIYIHIIKSLSQSQIDLDWTQGL